MNFLIVNTFGIGDVLFSTPLIRIIKTAYPDSKVNYVCNARAYNVLKNNPFLNEIIIFEKDYFRSRAKSSLIRFFYEYAYLLKKIKHLNINVAIDLTLNCQASLACRILRIPKIIGFNYKERGKFLTNKIELSGFEEKHVIFYYLDLLEALNIKAASNLFIETYASEKDDEWAEDFLRNNAAEGKFILGVIPGGGKSWGNEARYRRWPASNFAHVVDRLINDMPDMIVILFGDKGEISLCKNMQSFMRNKTINMSGQTTIGQLMALIKHCKLILCNEGGPFHISVALGVPTVSIFGPVNEKVYGPFSNNISKHIVVSDRSKCKPCYSKFKHKKCETLTCLNSISENQVFNSVKTLMKDIK